MKLWNKGLCLNKQIEKFTVGNDFQLDLVLLKYDCIASIAHAKMLNKIGVLNDDEMNKLISGLNEIISLRDSGKFEINPEDEDCHTAIENLLVSKYRDTGKKIHTARSRNDQVLTALRLYEKEELKEVRNLIILYKGSLAKVIAKYGKVKLPGYTHMQKAMPTSVEIWLGSFFDSAEDNLLLIDSVMVLVDQSPLGSAAGFGVPVFDVDKKMTAKLMGFSKVMDNPMHCQLSRGKFEATVMHVLLQMMFDLNKLSTDLMMFNMQEFGYIILPQELCTGSSIMPQKKNPDVLELVRAKYHVVLGEEFKVKSMIANLMSGYNRDMQLTKESLIKTVDIIKDCLNVMSIVLSGMKIDEDKCHKALSQELYATEEAYELAKSGESFRDAYQKISEKYNKWKLPSS